MRKYYIGGEDIEEQRQMFKDSFAEQYQNGIDEIKNEYSENLNDENLDNNDEYQTVFSDKINSTFEEYTSNNTNIDDIYSQIDSYFDEKLQALEEYYNEKENSDDSEDDNEPEEPNYSSIYNGNNLIVKATKYGYKGDHTSDKNSARGIGHSNNKLTPMVSVALSRTTARKLGISNGQMLRVKTPNGIMTVKYDDTIPEGYGEDRMDFYTPSGQLNFDGQKIEILGSSSNEISSNKNYNFNSSSLKNLSVSTTQGRKVKIDKINPEIFQALENLNLKGLKITSGTDGVHSSSNSSHYDGEAVDIGQSSNRESYIKFKKYIASLPSIHKGSNVKTDGNLKYIIEGNHIHVSKSSKGKN